MRTSYIEKMSASDRNISLEVYFSKLKKNYTYYTSSEKKSVESVSEDYLKPFSVNYISFYNTLQEYKCEISEGEYTDEEMDALKFKLAKNINLIESLLYKLCHDTIDSSIITENSSIEEVKRAIVWQFIDCVKEEEPAYQDVERIKMILHRYATENGQDNTPVIYEGGKIKKQVVQKYKKTLRVMLGDMFKVLENLVNFKQYLTVVEDLSLYSSTKNENLVYMKAKPDFERILALAESVKKLILNYLVGYVKVKQLNLPHSFLKGAQFSHSILFDSNLMSSELSDANFCQATMRNCDLSMCALENIKASGADFTGATLNYANLSGADLTNSVINDSAINSVTFFNRQLTGDYVNEGADSEMTITDLYYRSHRVEDKSKVSVNWKTDLTDKLSRNSTDELKSLTWEKTGLFSTLTDDINSKVSDLLDQNEAYNYTKCPVPDRMKELEIECSKNKKIYFNFNPAKLKNASVKRSALPDSNFSFVDLSGSSFDDTDLNDSRFNYNNAIGARFSVANFSKCKVYRGDFTDATFVDANLVETEFMNTKLSASSFENALLIGARFFNSDRKLSYYKELISYDSNQTMNMDDTEFPAKDTEQKWNGSVFAYSDMQDCNFQNCIATSSMFIGINLDRSIFSGADMKKCMFSNCLVRWSDLYKVVMSYSLFMGVSFNHTSLNETVFTNGRLFACDFSKCNMTKANFTSCRIDNVIFDNCDMDHAILSNSVFVNCVFRNMSFENTNISMTKFVNCRFEHAGITKAKNLHLSIHENSYTDEKESFDNLDSSYRDVFVFDGKIFNT